MLKQSVLMAPMFAFVRCSGWKNRRSQRKRICPIGWL